MIRRRLIAPLAAGVLAISAGSAHAAATAIPSSIPAGVNAMVNQDSSVITAHNSPSLGQSPVNPANLIVVDRVDRPDYTAGVHLSRNGGTSWQDSSLNLPAGSKSKLFAPTVVFDGKGVAYVLFVTLSGPGNGPDSVWIERSTDSGVTFDHPSQVAGANAFQTTLAVDTRTGRLFASWLQSNPAATHCNLCFAETGLPILITYSDDGGRSWSPPAQVSDPGRARIGAPALAVDRQGNPSVLYYDYGSDRVDWENLPGTYDAKFGLVVAHSNDRGVTFSAGQVVDTDIVPPHRFLIYLPDSPGFAVGANGRMVVVWADGRSGESDIFARTSGDNGATWTAPARVNQDPPGNGVSKDRPAAGIAPDGRVDVLYYDRILDHRGTTADVFLSSSSDGGRSFPKVVRVSSQSSDRSVGPQGSPFDTQADFGTRIALHSTNRQAVAVWTDTRSGTADTGRQDIYSGIVAIPQSSAITLAQAVIAIGGVLLGLAGVALFLGSRRHRDDDRKVPPRPPARLDTPPPLPPLVPSPGQV